MQSKFTIMETRNIKDIFVSSLDCFRSGGHQQLIGGQLPRAAMSK